MNLDSKLGVQFAFGRRRSFVAKFWTEALGSHGRTSASASDEAMRVRAAASFKMQGIVLSRTKMDVNRFSIKHFCPVPTLSEVLRRRGLAGPDRRRIPRAWAAGAAAGHCDRHT